MKVFSEESALQLSEMLLQNDKDIKEELERKIDSINVSDGGYDDTKIVERLETLEEGISDKADRSELPILDDYAKIEDIPDVSDFVVKEDNKGLFSGSYNDLVDQPNIPSIDGLVSEECLSTTLAEYAKNIDIPTSLPANGGNSNTVNEHTVESDVPANALFTDTIYNDTEVVSRINSIESSITTETTERKAEIAIERARIDAFTALPEGSTTGDAALEDIKIKVDGTTSDTAGNAVREQINILDIKIDESVADLKSDLNELGFRTGNLFNKETVTNGYIINNSGSEQALAGYCYSDYIPVKKGKTYCISYALTSGGGLYDINKTYVGKAYTVSEILFYHTFVPPIDGYVRLNMLKGGVETELNNATADDFIMSEGTELLSFPSYGKKTSERLELDASQVKSFENLVNKSNTLYGKNLVIFGDSRTWYNGNPYNDRTKEDLKGKVCAGYQQTVEKMLGCDIISQGVSGNTSAEICNRIIAYDFTNVDAVLLEGGVNDFVKQSSVTVGEISPIGSAFDTTTVYGAWQNAIEYILTNYPKVKIYMTIPAIAWTSSGLFPYETASIKKEIAELYNLPIVDLYRELGINEVNRDTFYCDNVELTSWHLHFNDYGNVVVGEKLAKFIMSN